MAARPKPKSKDDNIILTAVTEAQALLNDYLQDELVDKELIDKLFRVLDTPKVAEAVRRKSLELGH
jgi:hypothetical protein